MQPAGKPVQLLDYRQEQTSDGVVPNPAVLKSSGWRDLHFELHQQPTFATAEHQHTMHVLACGLDDSLGLAAGGRSLDGKSAPERRYPGDIAIIPADISHRCSWDTPAQFMVLAIEPTLLQQVGQDWVKADQTELIPHFMNQPDPFIQALFATLKAEVGVSSLGGPLLVDSLKTALAIHLLRHYCTTRPPMTRYPAGLSQTKLAQVRDYIHAHLDQDLKLEELAAIAQMSQYHFLRLFKQRLGVTPHQYILQSRIDRATELLQQSELSIAEIALHTGFCDQSHLTRQFKQRLGVTPKQLLQRRSQ